jgi:hypothetical protein
MEDTPHRFITDKGFAKLKGRGLRKRTALLLSAAAVSALMVAVIASAHAPTVTIDSIDGQSTAGSIVINVSSLPHTVTIAGTTTHEGPANISAVSTVEAFDNAALFHSGNLGNSGNDPSTTWTIPWTITTAGNHTILVRMKHGNDWGSDSETVSVVGVTVTCTKAAPAIAGAYLKNVAGWKPVSGQFKDAMYLVAQETGVNGSLWAGDKCDGTYEARVIAFVNANIWAP